MLVESLVGVVATVLAVAGQPKPPADDLDALQGGWRVVTLKSDGKNYSDELTPRSRFDFKGARVTMNSGTEAREFGIKLGKADATRTIDLSFRKGNKDVTVLGIYQIDGDTLRVAHTAPGQPRAKTFTPKAADDGTVFVLRREKPGDDKLLAGIDDGFTRARKLLEGGKPAEAAESLTKVIEQAAAYYGPDHARSVEFLFYLGEASVQSDKYAEADAALTKALTIAEAEYEPDHPVIDSVANNLGVVCLQLMDFARAEKLALRSLAIAEKKKDPGGTAVSLHNLANVYMTAGEYGKAEPLYLRSRDLLEKAGGKDSPVMALVLDNLGSLYRKQGRYDAAVVVLARARAIAEKAHGAESVEAARVLGNLAAVYGSTGSNERAREYLNAVLAIRVKKQGKNHPDVAGARSDLGMVLSDLGLHKEAQEQYEASIAAYTATLGPNHPLLANPLRNLAVHHAGVHNDLPKAVELIERSRKLLETAYGPDHPETVRVRVYSAALRNATGDTAGAIRAIDVAITAYRAMLPKDHPALAYALEHRAIFHAFAGQPDQARGDLQEAFEIQEVNLRRTFAFVDETGMYRLAFQAASQIDLFPLVVGGKPVEGEAARAIYECVLRRKGVVLETLSRYRRARSLVAADPVLAAKAEHWRALRQQIADLPLRKGITRQDLAARLARLNEEASGLENELHRAITATLGAGGSDPKVSLVDAVREKLRPGEVLVEFKGWQPFRTDRDPKQPWFGERRYVAFVLTRDSRFPRVVDLDGGRTNDDKPIDAQIEQMVKDFKEDTKPQWSKPVFDHLFGPLATELAGVKSLLVAPDGLINLVPFPALHDGKEFLIQKCPIACLTSGRDLLRPAGNQKATGITIFNRPDYAKPGEAVAAPAGGPARPPAPTLPGSSGSWQELADVREAEAIQQAVAGSTLAGVKTYTGAAASEERLKAMPPPRILHVITHGFYFETEAESVRMLSPTSRLDTRLRATDNPFLKSGIVLAGANRAVERKDGGAPEREDGWVTAEEVALLDLNGTELVVLSACLTGVGEVKRRGLTTEGVFGVRRSFLVAGARSLVVTMISIPNTPETAALMKRFYAHLAAGLEPAEALRQAQLAMLTATDKDGKKGQHPFYWGSFLVVGSPR